MASSTELTFLAVAVLLLQAPWFAVAEQAGVMTLTSFEEGESSPAECDGSYHSNQELIAALSTDRYGGGAMCNKLMRITYPSSGQNMVAVVVDECDTENGCKDNMIATSKLVWDMLGLDTDLGVVNVTWAFF